MLSFTFDKELEMKATGLIAADAAWTVGGSAKIIDLGSATALFVGALIADVSAIETASNDEVYRLLVQGSSSASFASDIQNLAELTLGATAARPGGAITSLVGRYILPFTNQQADVNYRYLRGYTDVAGTIATGINFTAWAARFNNVG